MPLTKVSQITYGYPFNSKLFSSKATNKKALVRIRDVLKGYTKTYTSEICDKSYLIHKGDLLVGMDGEFNISEWKSAPAYLNQRVCRIEPIGIDRLYLKYFLQIQLKKIEDRTTFVTVKHLSAKALNNIIVSVPSAEYQRKISSILNIIDNSIFLQLRRLNVLNDLVKSQFIETFGDPVINNKELPVRLLGDISLIKTGPFGSLLHKEDYENSNHFLVNPQHIFRDSIHCKSGESISDKKFHQLTAYHLLPGDIVLARRGEMGRCAVVKSVGLICGTGSLIIRVNKSILLPQVIQLMISLPSYRKFIQSRSVGATLENINAKITSALPVIVPKLNIQTTFMKKIDQLNKSKFVELRELHLPHRSA